MLVLTDLISLLTGWFSLGFALLGLLPQITKNFVEKPRHGGPSLLLLCSWVLAATCTAAGLIITKGLVTQIASVSWYVIGMSTMLFQKVYYGGYVPGTERYHDRKANKWGATNALVQALHSSHTSKAHWWAPWLFKQPGPPIDHEHASRSPHEVHELGSRYARREKRGRRGRRGYVELEPGKGKGKTRRKDVVGKEVKEGAFTRGFRWAFEKHNTATQCILLGTMSTAMFFVWLTINFLHRDTMPALEHPIPPTVNGEWQEDKLVVAGFFIGWTGSLLFSAPRLWQVGVILYYKTTKGISPWMFAILSLENIMAIISMWIVSRDPSYLYAQSANLFGIGAALSFDIIFLLLHWAFRKNPAPPGIPSPWSEPAYVFPNHVVVVPGPTLERDDKLRANLAAVRAQFVAHTERHSDMSHRLHPACRKIFGDDLDKTFGEIHAGWQAHHDGITEPDWRVVDSKRQKELLGKHIVGPDDSKWRAYQKQWAASKLQAGSKRRADSNRRANSKRQAAHDEDREKVEPELEVLKQLNDDRQQRDRDLNVADGVGMADALFPVNYPSRGQSFTGTRRSPHPLSSSSESSGGEEHRLLTAAERGALEK